PNENSISEVTRNEDGALHRSKLPVKSDSSEHQRLSPTSPEMSNARPETTIEAQLLPEGAVGTTPEQSSRPHASRNGAAHMRSMDSALTRPIRSPAVAARTMRSPTVVNRPTMDSVCVEVIDSESKPRKHQPRTPEPDCTLALTAITNTSAESVHISTESQDNLQESTCNRAVSSSITSSLSSNQLSKAPSEPEAPVSSCTGANPTHLPSCIMPATTDDQNQSIEELSGLSSSSTHSKATTLSVPACRANSSGTLSPLSSA
ncbi:hypothetical protein V565_199680, partial [Rhizoctonia solani 123E]